jgi:hypothetical protein
MKIIKKLLLILVICSIGYLSWVYFEGKSLDRKLERATLVMEHLNNKSILSYERMNYLCR